MSAGKGNSSIGGAENMAVANGVGSWHWRELLGLCYVYEIAARVECCLGMMKAGQQQIAMRCDGGDGMVCEYATGRDRGSKVGKEMDPLLELLLLPLSKSTGCN